MKNNQRILVTGGNGMVGKHLNRLQPNAIYVSSQDYNLVREAEVKRMFTETRPTTVIHLAARVGGIFDNIGHPAEFYDENMLMNTLVLREAHRNGVTRFYGLLSTCAYPDVSDHYPLTEEDLHAGPPPPTNFPYAHSKRGLAVQIDAYNRQYGTRYCYLIPCNLYGEYDKFDEGRSHLLPAIVKKIYLANRNRDDKIIVFGDGTPLRQFLHARDLAEIIYLCLKHDVTTNMNVATEENLTIHEIARIALRACDSEHLRIEHDPTKPNGQMRKDVSIVRFRSVFPEFRFTPLETGIRDVYRWYATEQERGNVAPDLDSEKSREQKNRPISERLPV
ncbi:NAD-dependent epimerase/dehydratase family protein [bacterium]|nr:NAD-dependent epimerase/dehydratase family protein [bacterium]MBU1984309.1 NAD-dependent epimerase/dehydratase family protein [bacterium]